VVGNGSRYEGSDTKADTKDQVPKAIKLECSASQDRGKNQVPCTDGLKLESVCMQEHLSLSKALHFSRACGPRSTFNFIMYKQGINTPFSIHTGMTGVLENLAFPTGLRAWNKFLPISYMSMVVTSTGTQKMKRKNQGKEGNQH
jgi:hypothetical protein